MIPTPKRSPDAIDGRVGRSVAIMDTAWLDRMHAALMVPDEELFAEFAAAVGNMRAQHFNRLHELGPRPMGELLLEIAGNDDDGRATLLAASGRYEKLDGSTVRALGGDVFPPAPLHEVPK